MSKDKDYRRMLGSVRWRLLRAAVLAEHPICQRCSANNFVTLSTEVHHVRPVEYGLSRADKERLCFDPSNLLAVCHRCHVEIHKAMGRSGRAATKRINEAKTAAFGRRYLGEEADE